jgi:hypothetical protein
MTGKHHPTMGGNHNPTIDSFRRQPVEGLHGKQQVLRASVLRGDCYFLFLLNKKSPLAMTYSPGGSPPKYHRR